MTESLFLRLLGLVYLSAFGSLWPQMAGLVGVNGIAPAAETLLSMHHDYGWHAYWYVPSLFWLFPTDGALRWMCALGCAAGVLLLVGVAVRSAALAAYVLYLSLVTVGQPFTSFQWDSLLLETGFLAMFAGASFLPFAYRFLLFRLMFESGLVKLTSGDVNWRNLHALRYHFFTQPLPTPLAYYMHFAPGWLLDALTLATLFIELGVPILLFAYPRRVRQIAAALLASLQFFIALTGNYAFFNLLTLGLCLWALDDECFPRWLHWRIPALPRFKKLLDAAVVAMMALSVLQIFALEPSFLEPFDIVNPYGLFAVMTTSRTELVVEGSDDNLHWREYSFRYKPGERRRTLPIIAPYQPRLDWQMWFAALGTVQDNLWVRVFCYRLLQGDATVLALLDQAPFSKPPHYIRILAYRFTFAEPAERRRDGTIWQRKLLGTWMPPESLFSRE